MNNPSTPEKASELPVKDAIAAKAEHAVHDAPTTDGSSEPSAPTDDGAAAKTTDDAVCAVAKAPGGGDAEEKADGAATDKTEDEAKANSTSGPARFAASGSA